ncbi:MAG: transcription elongation factor GreB [Nitrosomonadaceae bacterium]
MSKLFTEETKLIDDLEENKPNNQLPIGSKNYITPGGHARLMGEFLWLMNKERPEVTAIVSWAAGNGDRSENSDYIYGKKRLREIDRRIHFLTKRLDIAEIVDPTAPREDKMRIFFGATVTFSNQRGKKKTVSIVGIDEIDTTKGYISWISPMARALTKARQGDIVNLHAPDGVKKIEVLEVKYQTIPMELFEMTAKR